MAQDDTTQMVTLQDAETLSLAGRNALDEALGRLPETERLAYWASVRKCFNAPYEDDGHKRRRAVPQVVEGGDCVGDRPHA